MSTTKAKATKTSAATKKTVNTPKKAEELIYGNY